MAQSNPLRADNETQYMMPRLNTLFRSIEAQKAEMLRYVETLTDEERNQNLTPAEWSPLQVMEHIVSVEELTTAAGLQSNARVLLKGHIFITLGGGLMRLCARSGLRTPTLPVFEPSGEHDFQTIKQRWDEATNALAPKLVSVTRETQPFVMHPVAGPLSARQFFELLDVHLAYHWRHFPRVRATSSPTD